MEAHNTSAGLSGTGLNPDTAPCQLPGVLHHSFVERRGGAARVADLLSLGMAGLGVPTARSFEAVQSQAGQDWLDARQGDWFQALREALAAGWTLHLHGSGDMLGLLARLESLLPLVPAAPRLVLTYHDMRLATGGCVFPTDCPRFHQDCADPCPRGLPDTAARRRRAVALLQTLRPLGLCPSQWGCELLRKALPNQEIHLAPNGVPWPAALPVKAAAKAAVGLAAGARLVVFVAHGGEAAGVKAGEVWLPLWQRIKAAVPQAVGYFIGGNAHSREGDLVRWPYLESDRLSAMLAAADCLAYPSWADNHPLILLEAQAAGCPVATWAAGGIAEIVHHDRTGLVRPVGDVPGLAGDVVSLLRQPTQGRTLAAAAHRAGQGRFAQAVMTRRVLRLLTESRAV